MKTKSMKTTMTITVNETKKTLMKKKTKMRRMNQKKKILKRIHWKTQWRESEGDGFPKSLWIFPSPFLRFFFLSLFLFLLSFLALSFPFPFPFPFQNCSPPLLFPSSSLPLFFYLLPAADWVVSRVGHTHFHTEMGGPTRPVVSYDILDLYADRTQQTAERTAPLHSVIQTL